MFAMIATVFLANSLETQTSGGDVVYLYDDTVKWGSDHGMSYMFSPKVYGWYERGSSYFIHSNHYGTIFGNYNEGGTDRINAERVTLCAKAWYNNYLVDINCEDFYINDGWWSGEVNLHYNMADKLATRIIVKWDHQYKVLWWWFSSHKFTNRTYYYEAMVSL